MTDDCCKRFKLITRPFLCENFMECCWDYYVYKVIRLQCIVNQFFNKLSEPDLILKSKGKPCWRSEVGVNSTLLALVSRKFRLQARHITCRRDNKLVWIIPRRFRFSLEFLSSLLLSHECYAELKHAAWYRKLLKWMKIDFYEQTIPWSDRYPINRNRSQFDTIEYEEIFSSWK